VLGVLTDKHALLTGSVTQRVEVVPAGNIFERFAQFHERVEKLADARIAAKLADAHEVSSAECLNNHLVPENFEQKENGSGLAEPRPNEITGDSRPQKAIGDSEPGPQDQNKAWLNSDAALPICEAERDGDNSDEETMPT
jgi:hypothetical protein